MSEKDILNLVSKLCDGIEIDNAILVAEDLATGRFIEERNLRLFLIKSGIKEHFAYMKCFSGRPPYYRPWIEVFSINPDLLLYKEKAGREFLKILSEALSAGESLFIEYGNDSETMKMLERGIKPEDTPLGRELKKLGFRWFKDWYFPEGAMEGGQKLQAHK